MPVADLFAESDLRFSGYRESARITVVKAAAGRMSAQAAYASYGAPHSDTFGGQEQASAIKQYAAAKIDWMWACIRPICTKIAAQAVRVGTKAEAVKRGTNGPSAGGKPVGRRRAGQPGKIRTKAYDSVQSYRSAPEYIRKSIAEGLETLENHELLPAFENPNPVMTGWALKFCTVFSICATGQAHWYIEKLDGNLDDGQPSIRLWFMPAHWMTPIHTEERPFAAWRVRPPGDAEGWIAPAESIAHFMFHDPSNPLLPMSPLQSQAKAINTDTEIQKAQYASMVNGGKPGLVISVGRTDPPPASQIMASQMPRQLLTPEQRKQLITAARLAHSGSEHYGDPIIIDALIESVTPYTRTPAELDFLNSSQLTKDRISQGIGTGEVIMGKTDNANRAGSTVAHEVHYANTVNPIITMVSQVMTKSIAPLFKSEGEELFIWIEEAKAHDPEMSLSQMQLLAEAGAVKKNEIREAFDMPPLDGADGDELVELNPEPPMPAGGGPGGAARPQGARRAAGSTKKKPAAKKKNFDDLDSKYNNGPRRVTGQWSGGIVDSDDALSRVMASPQFAAREASGEAIDWEAHAEAWGIRGNFHQMQLPAVLLGKMLDRGTLSVSSKLSEETIAAKATGENGEKINPTIIVFATGPGGPTGREKLAVVDGSHSLMARIRQAVAAGEEGADVAVDCMVSAAAVERMMLS